MLFTQVGHKYEITEKIMTLVTDNASNMTKAFEFSLPGYTTEKQSDAVMTPTLMMSVQTAPRKTTVSHY